MKKNKKGDAMIMVICIMAIFLALSLAAIFSASSLMSGVMKSKNREQCRLSAVTFSKMLKEEFEWKTDYEDTTKNKLRNYIREEIESGTWAYYNENEPGHRNKDYLEFSVDSDTIKDLAADAGEIRMKVYWTSDAASAMTGDYREATVEVEVNCGLKGQKQIIHTSYSIDFQPYKADGSVEEDDMWGIEDYIKWKNEGHILAWHWVGSEMR